MPQTPFQSKILQKSWKARLRRPSFSITKLKSGPFCALKSISSRMLRFYIVFLTFCASEPIKRSHNPKNAPEVPQPYSKSRFIESGRRKTRFRRDRLSSIQFWECARGAPDTFSTENSQNSPKILKTRLRRAIYSSITRVRGAPDSTLLGVFTCEKRASDAPDSVQFTKKPQFYSKFFEFFSFFEFSVGIHNLYGIQSTSTPS